MTILKEPLDYTRRCDKCENWLPEKIEYSPEGICEGDAGTHCSLSNVYNSNRISKEEGYSRLVQRVIDAMTLEFLDGDEIYCSDEEERIMIFVTMANCCPLFDEKEEIEIKESKGTLKTLRGLT